MMALKGLEQLPWLFGAAAGTSAALARPPSRPRRVPGGTVAGVWEPSPAGPRAGAAREGEALAAVAQPLGQRSPGRPSWALALALLAQAWSSFGAPWDAALRGKRIESHGPHLPTARVEAGEGGWGACQGRRKQRATSQWIGGLGAGMIAVNYLINDFSWDFPLWSWGGTRGGDSGGRPWYLWPAKSIVRTMW